jgi:hypothetical protein
MCMSIIVAEILRTLVHFVRFQLFEKDLVTSFSLLPIQQSFTHYNVNPAENQISKSTTTRSERHSIMKPIKALCLGCSW